MKKIAHLVISIAALSPACAFGQVCAKQISVPKYVPIARAAQMKGTVDLAITVGAHGEVLGVEGSGKWPALVDGAKTSVKSWVFCAPDEGGQAHVQLHFDYRLEGKPVYPPKPAKVVIDLGSGTVVITAHPPKIET